MDVVCTGKGQHRRVKLGEFRDGEMRSGEGWPYYYPFGHWASMHSKEPVTGTRTFTCRRCGRSPQLSAAKLVAALDGLQAVEAWELDVSLLPF